jgi:hypothetical protein
MKREPTTSLAAIEWSGIAFLVALLMREGRKLYAASNVNEVFHKS